MDGMGAKHSQTSSFTQRKSVKERRISNNKRQANKSVVPKMKIVVKSKAQQEPPSNFTTRRSFFEFNGVGISVAPKLSD